MTTFKQVCLELFHRRNRYIKLFLVVQALVVVFYSLFILTFHRGYSFLVSDNLEGWLIPYSITTLTTMMFDIVFLGWAIYKNEKWQTSQTFRLIPISDTKLFLANIISTILNCIIIFIPQMLVVSFLNGATAFGTASKFSWHEFWKGVTAFWIMGGDPKGFEMCLSLTAIVLLIMTFVSFVNFSSQTIANLFAAKNRKLIRWLSTAIIVIVGAYLAIQVDGIINAYWEKIERRFMDVPSQMTQADAFYLNMMEFVYPCLIIIGFVIILGALDLWLYNKYVESKANNY